MNNDNQFKLWEVFIQSKSGQPYVHAGSVHASDGAMAMQNARDTYTRRGAATSIWIAPSSCFKASNPENNDMLFDPANDKIYRHPTFYTMPEGATHI
jgi:ring-1,2-phenylacetyl-CoA epoxidase subunit PaaB